MPKNPHLADQLNQIPEREYTQGVPEQAAIFPTPNSEGYGHEGTDHRSR